MTNVIQFPGAAEEAPMWEDVPEMRQPIIIRVEQPAPPATGLAGFLCWVAFGAIVATGAMML